MDSHIGAADPSVGHILSHGGVAVSMKLDDYDQDGTLEAIVRYRFVLTCPGGGENILTRVALVEVGDELTLARTQKSSITWTTIIPKLQMER